MVIWDYFETDAQKNMMQDIIDGFNESQEEYEASHVYVPFADYEKQLTLGMASGELPDLVILDGCSMASFIQMDLFGDVSDADIKWDEYLEGPMESTMADGNITVFPLPPTVRHCSTTRISSMRQVWSIPMKTPHGKISMRWQKR